MDEKKHLRHSIDLAKKIKKTVKAYAGHYEDILFPAGHTGDTTYEIDVPVEEAVKDFFVDKGIEAVVMTEDMGAYTVGENPQAIYLIDPLDGSRNARRGIPFYCTSIAVYPPDAKLLSDCMVGVVSRLDCREDYTALSSGPARCNGKKIKPSGKSELYDAVLSLGSHFTNSYPVHSTFIGELSKKNPGVNDVMLKCLGASALELSYLACGKIDALVDLRSVYGVEPCLKTYDVAAGAHICRQTGVNMIYGTSKLGENVGLDPRNRVSVVAAGSDKLFMDLSNMIAL
ncbi:MAG: hypothetical protein KKD39_08870 [Candidatus Altiarchaeota archaeon]|nr:hypothetical protein [Candidatus Altiarchaeota archaeon]